MELRTLDQIASRYLSTHTYSKLAIFLEQGEWYGEGKINNKYLRSSEWQIQDQNPGDLMSSARWLAYQFAGKQSRYTSLEGLKGERTTQPHAHTRRGPHYLQWQGSRSLEGAAKRQRTGPSMQQLLSTNRQSHAGFQGWEGEKMNFRQNRRPPPQSSPS